MKLPKTPPEKRWKVEMFGPVFEWETEVTGSRAYCKGYFYGIIDALPHPACRLLDPDGEVWDERDAARCPQP